MISYLISMVVSESTTSHMYGYWIRTRTTAPTGQTLSPGPLAFIESKRKKALGTRLCISPTERILVLYSQSKKIIQQKRRKLVYHYGLIIENRSRRLQVSTYN